MKAGMELKAIEAAQTAREIVQTASQQAEVLKKRILGQIETDSIKAREARQVAEWQANNFMEEARKQAKEAASQARKEAREKTKKVEETLAAATVYAAEIRERADERAKEIGGRAYEALKRKDDYEAIVAAMQNVVGDYADIYMVPSSHVLDELAEEYGFNEAGERLKFARDRTRSLEKTGNAATCNFPEGWKREYAIRFVLDAFNGKVDSTLSKVKTGNQARLIQEIKDIYTLTNHNGEVFKQARIREEYLEARLDELKWAIAVQRVKEKEREEQRAIREQIREEEKRRKEYERLIKQTEREEYLLARAIKQAQDEAAASNAEDREKYEGKLRVLEAKLREAEEKNRRAISQAQQTRSGHVYVISNIGSFGEGVYKIGLTRRLEPLDRVKELGDASVPFAFDVHAMIYAEDAPALETALHRKFIENQVNKVNRRKEFFRLKLQDIRSVIEGMNHEVKWTMAAEARDYRETISMERQMQEDPEFRKRWADSEAAYEASLPLYEESEESMQQEDENLALVEDAT